MGQAIGFCETVNKTNHVTIVLTKLRYDVALLYLQQADYDLDRAVAAYLEDEKWEKEHPMEGSSKVMTKIKPARLRFRMRTGFTGQL